MFADILVIAAACAIALIAAYAAVWHLERRNERKAQSSTLRRVVESQAQEQPR